MKLQEVIATLNRMRDDGVIERYAIGGAVGATFYLEPISTLDVDVFVAFEASSQNVLLDLQPIYNYLKQQGGVVERKYIVLSGWPVQILPPTNALAEEALTQAVIIDVEGVLAPVFSAEHLAAIALQTGRAKDKARLLQFIEENALNWQNFEEIVARHDLQKAWQRFKQQFLDES